MAREEAAPGTSTGTAVAEPEMHVDRPWVTIVWDDPVNLMNYVSYVFQKIFGYSEPRARELMMQVHTEGKAVVSSGDRSKMEIDVRKLHAAGLWATMQHDG
ncbi:MAG: ATP-dependent Clp protease adapter ClpS [Gordonia sp. (in: high G+C Gram-positive bacteria)]